MMRLPILWFLLPTYSCRTEWTNSMLFTRKSPFQLNYRRTISLYTLALHKLNLLTVSWRAYWNDSHCCESHTETVDNFITLTLRVNQITLGGLTWNEGIRQNKGVQIACTPTSWWYVSKDYLSKISANLFLNPSPFSCVATTLPSGL